MRSDYNNALVYPFVIGAVILLPHLGYAQPVPLEGPALAQAWIESTQRIASFRASVQYSIQHMASIPDEAILVPLELDPLPAPDTFHVDWVVDATGWRFRYIVRHPDGSIAFAGSNAHTEPSGDEVYAHFRPDPAAAAGDGPMNRSRRAAYAPAAYGWIVPYSCPLFATQIRGLEESFDDLRFGGSDRPWNFGFTGDARLRITHGTSIEAVGPAVHCQRLTLEHISPDGWLPFTRVWLDHDAGFLPRRIEQFVTGTLFYAVHSIVHEERDGAWLPTSAAIDILTPTGTIIKTMNLLADYVEVNASIEDEAFDLNLPDGRLRTRETDAWRRQARPPEGQAQSRGSDDAAMAVSRSDTLLLRRMNQRGPALPVDMKP